MRTATMFLLLFVAPSTLAAGASPAAASLSFIGCATVFAGYPVPIDSVQALLPPGFTAQRFTNDPTGATGTISVYVSRCERAESEAGLVAAPYGEAWLVVRAIPPEPWRDPDATASFWIAEAVADSPTAAAIFAEWNVADDPAGPVTLSRTFPLANVYALEASGDGPSLAFSLRSANGQAPVAWREQHIRFFGRGPDGAIGALDHHDRAGLQGGIQPSAIEFERGFDALGPRYVGVGRDFRWAPARVSWTASPIDLPPL